MTSNLMAASGAQTCISTEQNNAEDLHMSEVSFERLQITSMRVGYTTKVGHRTGLAVLLCTDNCVNANSGGMASTLAA